MFLTFDAAVEELDAIDVSGPGHVSILKPADVNQKSGQTSNATGSSAC